MPQISVISETNRNILQQTNSINNISLTESALVVLSVATTDLVSVARSGTSLTISLLNSQPITISNYFNIDGTTKNILALAPTSSTSIYQVNFTLADGASTTAAKLSTYSSTDALLNTQVSPVTTDTSTVTTDTTATTAKVAATSLLAAGTATPTAASGVTLGLVSDTGASSSDGITNNPNITVSGVTSTTSWQYSTDGGTTWKTGTGSTQIVLPQGTYAANSIVVKVTDTTGNVTTASLDSAVTIDTTAPITPTLLLANDTGSSKTDFVTSNGTVRVTGIESGATWQYSTDSGTTWKTGTGNTFVLAEGVYVSRQVIVRVTDTAGNVSNPAYLSKTTVDNTAPIAPTLQLQTDTGSSNTDGITNNGTIKVTGLETSSTWQYSVDGGVTWLNGSGTSFVVAQGNYTANQIEVRQYDLAGNVSQVGVYNSSLSVITTLPTAPTAALLHDTGVSATDGITTDGTVNVSNIPTGATWQYSLDGGQTWVNGTGSSFVVPEGSSNVQVRSTDVAGNNSTPYSVGVITVDTVAPTTATIALAQDTGASATDGITSNGTINVSGLETGATWQYSTDGGKTWIAGTSSSFVLPQGTYAANSVLVKQTDVAGNVGASSAITSAITVDNTAPNQLTVGLAQDTGASATDGITSNGTINVAGVETGATWQYSTDGGNTWAIGTGSSFVLPQGTYAANSVLVKQTDVAGNVGTSSAIATAITVDNTAPNQLTVSLAQDTGSSATDGITSNGTINVAGVETGATWQYSTDGGNTWTTGTGTSFLLPQGTYAANSVLVKQTDVAGNVGANSAITSAITVDNTAPNPLTVGLAQDTGTSATDGITNNGTINITGLETGATWQYSTDGGKTWIAGTGSSFVLQQGTYAANSVLVKQTDVAGNVGVSSAITSAITVDTTAPAATTLKLAQDTGVSATDGITNNGTINVTGLETGATWQYSTDSGKTWITGTGSSFTLPQGTYAANSVLVKQTDVAGNVGASSAITSSITVDTTAPNAASLTLAQDTGSSSTDGITSNGTINVSGIESGASWQYSTDNGTTWKTGSGTSFVLSDGTYPAGQVQVQVLDVAGNISASSKLTAVTITQSTTAVATVALANDTGTSNTDGITSDGTMNVSGVPTGSSWQYSIDGGTTWVNGSGYSFKLAEGTYPAGQVQVRVVDLAGNLGAATKASSITVDTTAPNVVTIKLAQDTGVSATDGITNNGTINVTGLESGATWQYSTDGGKTWVSGTGSSFVLPQGTYAANSVLVKQTDAAGNTGVASTISTAITVDTTAPAATTVKLAQDTGVSATDGITNNGTVNVTGLESGATWQYSTDGGATWTTGTSSSFTLAQGTYAANSVLVKQTDTAGNTGVTSAIPTAITVDTTAPAATTVKLAQDTGISATDGITNNGTVNVTGLESGATWQYSTDAGKTWTAGTGSSFTLVQGTYAANSVLVKQTDVAGNTGAISTIATAITVDTTAPAATTVKLAQDTGVSATDGITNNGTVNVTGLETGATWQYSTDGGTTWTVGTGSSFTLAQGTYAANSVVVKQTDIAGNTGVTSAISTAITVDTTAPAATTVKLAQDTGISATDGITNNGTVNVTGLESGATWQYSTDGGTTWTAGTGSSFTLAQGTYAANSVVVKQTDVAGNTGVTSAISTAITVDTTAPAATTVKLAQDTGVSATDGITNNGTVNVTGLESGATWQYSTDAGKTWTAGTGSSFTLAQGIYAANSVLVKQTDVAGNTGVTSAIATAITVDTTAPAATTVKLAQDTGVSAIDGITNNGTVNVTGLESGATWQYSTDGGATWTTGTGSSFTLAQGTYAANSVLVKQTDVAGNTGATSTIATAITVDTTAPAVATIKLAQDTGSSATDGITNNGTIAVSGIESGATWQYTTDGGKTWTAGTGSSFVLPEGTYASGNVQVQVVDVAGNISKAATINSSVVVDLTAPNAAAIALAQDTGASATDGITNNGTINVTGVEANAFWQYSTDGGQTWTTGTGSSFALAQGSYAANTVQVRVLDLAGNISKVSGLAQAVTVDTTAPSPATLALANDTGISNTDGITSDGTVNVSNVEAGATWQYSVDGGKTWTTGTGSSFVLGQGVYAAGVVQAKVTDVAGNSTITNFGAVTVDTTAPTNITVKITGMTDDTGNQGDWVTTDHTLTISGTVSRALNADETVQISHDGGKTWINATATSATTWSAIDPTTLSTTNYTYQARVVDTAGNVGATSSQGINVVDLQANSDIASITGYATLPAASNISQSSSILSLALQGLIIRADAASDSNSYTVGQGDVNTVTITAGSLSLGAYIGALYLEIYKYNAATGNYEFYKEDQNFGAAISILLGISGGTSVQTLSEGKYIFTIRQAGLGINGSFGGLTVAGKSQDYGQLVTKGNVVNDGTADIHTGSVTVTNISSATGNNAAVNQDTNYTTSIQGQYGTLKIAANGNYVYERDYTNNQGIGKVDTFTYTLKDQWGNTSTAKVYVQIGANGLTFDPTNPGADASANITAVADSASTYNAISVSQTKTFYSSTDMDNKIVSPDSVSDKGTIDFTGNAIGQASVTSGFIFTSTDVNYANVTVDANSVLNLNYTVSTAYGSTVYLTIQKYVNGAWATVSTGYSFNYSVYSSSPATISVYNSDNSATQYRIVMNTSGGSSYSTNSVSFDTYGLTNSSTKIGVYNLSTSNVTGNVTSNDIGKEFAKVTDVNGISVSSTGTTTINSSTGTGKLVISADGSYTYIPGNVQATDLGKTDVFHYTITAGKSVSAADLTFNITANGAVMSDYNAGSNTIIGSNGNDIYVSRGTNDTFNISGGNDTIIYNLLNKNDPTGGNGQDIANGFTVAKSNNWNSNIDFIDVRGLLSDQTTSSSTIKNFISSVQVKNSSGGTDTVISIDRDGAGSNYNSTQLLTLKNVSTSVDELLQTHQLLY